MFDLVTCPFCGGRAEFSTKRTMRQEYIVGLVFSIGCPDCGMASGHCYDVVFRIDERGNIVYVVDERQKAVDEWNKRA